MNHQLQTILHYFPDLKVAQRESLARLGELYNVWNEKINLISRQDMPNFYLHHVLHSLTISWYVKFTTDDRILDVGTGGGFPGIPLAILYPSAEFILIDSTKKKLGVVEEVCKELQIDNVTTLHARVEEHRVKHTAIISRAVSDLPTFIRWVMPSVRVSKPEHKGIYYLKGGDCHQEAEATGLRYKIFPLSTKIKEPYFETKNLVVFRP